MTPVKIESPFILLSETTDPGLGALKSCLQKIIRFHAVAVQAEEPIPSPVAAATATALLFANRGGFSPELQLFTRGATAAFKRLAVILLEDGYVKEGATPQSLVALLALGLVTQRVSDYEPSRTLVVAAMRLAAQAAASGCLIAWRGMEKAGKGKVQDHINVTSQQATMFQHAAKLLRLLRSFPGDMAMFDQVAAASKAGKLPVQYAARRPDVMPLCHLVDQHTFRGIAHVLGKGAESTFALRFQSLFNKCTGFNPRQADVEGFESRPEVLRARFAQQCCLDAAQQKPKTLLPLISEGMSVSLELDPGVLSAAVGPVPAKAQSKRGSRDLLVMLGVRCPEDEVVTGPNRWHFPIFGLTVIKQGACALHGKDDDKSRSCTSCCSRSRSRGLLLVIVICFFFLLLFFSFKVMLKPARATRDLFGDLTDQDTQSCH